MRAINYSNFRQNLRSHLRAVNTDSEPLIVTAKKSKNNVVIVPVAEYDALIETASITANPYLMTKIRRGDAQIATSKF